jgi:hypothetical protein
MLISQSAQPARKNLPAKVNLETLGKSKKVLMPPEDISPSTIPVGTYG